MSSLLNSFISFGGAGAGGLSPALFTDADSFHAPTLAVGAVTLAPSLHSDGDTFHSPVMVAGEILSPSLFADADSFHSATVSAGAVALSSSLFSDGDTFHTATVSEANYGPVFTDNTGTNSAAASYTFTGRNIGTAHADRVVVVCVFWQYSTARIFTGGSIGGVNTTVATGVDEGIGIMSASVPSGATGDIVVNFGGSVTNCAIAVFDTRPASATKVDAGYVATASNVTSQTVADIEVKDGGFLIVCGRHITAESGSAVYNGVDSLGSADVWATVGSMNYYAWSCSTTEDATTNDPGWSSSTATPKRTAAATWL